MGNSLSKTTYIGTIGELLVQLRLLEFGIQAAPPIKDSGNDLIAIRGEIVKFIQVKTSQGAITRVDNLPDIYHLVALVELKYNKGVLLLDETKIYIYKKNETVRDKKELMQSVVNAIWSE